MTQLSSALDPWAQEACASAQSIPVLMISGAQGIGKTTALQALAEHPNRRFAILGLDDFYLPKAERQRLAQRIHPLCETRGPPGTHDVNLLIETIEALSWSSGSVTWPRFDKRIDDRAPADDGHSFTGQPDAIIVEGWMLGAQADASAPLDTPLNALERRQDLGGHWRAWQEAELAGAYADLWDRCDGFCYLLAPGFDAVLNWRIEQEETTLGLPNGTLPEDRKAWVEEFIQHYERLTRRILSGGRRPGHSIHIGYDRSVL